MKKTFALMILAAVLCIAQIGTPFAVLPPVAPVAAVPGAQLVYDVTNKLLYIQTVPGVGLTPTNVLSFNPHVFDNGGSFNINLVVGTTTINVVVNTANGLLVYTLATNNPTQTKTCSTAVPPPTGVIACAAIPF